MGSPDVVSFNAAISACEKGHRTAAALALHRDMQLDGVEPNLVTANSLLSACGRGTLWRETLTFFRDFLQRRGHPDVITYNAAITACERAGQWQEVLALLQKMPSHQLGPSLVTLNAALLTMSRAGRTNEFFEIADEHAGQLPYDDQVIGRMLMESEQSAKFGRAADLERAASRWVPQDCLFDRTVLACAAWTSAVMRLVVAGDIISAAQYAYDGVQVTTCHKGSAV